jgi:predicted aspartyl protease
MPAQSLALFGWVLLAAASEPIRLPVTLMQSNPVTTITVGDRPVQAIVDTGGGALMLSREVIDAAGGVKLEDTQISNDASGNEHVHARFRMPLIDIGGLVLRDTVVIEAPGREAGRGSPVPDVIGREFLAQYFVVVDYAGGVITLWSPDPENPERAKCGRTRIPMERTEEQHLAVSVFETQSGRLRLAWDTGAMYSVLPIAMAENLRPTTITRGDTKFYPSRMLAAAGHDFGPLEFVLLPLQPPKDFQGMLGSNFFAKHVVCFDYAHRELRVR